MTRLRRLVAISTLMVSLSGVALAGDTLTPPIAPPPPPAEWTTDCSGTAVTTPAQPAEDSSVDIVTEVAIFASWFAMSIL